MDVVRLLALISLFAFAGVKAAFADKLSSTQPASTQPVELNIGIDLWPGYYPVQIAKSRGLFDPAKLNVQIHIPQDTDKLLQKFIAGEWQAIAVAAGDLLTLLEMAPDARIVLVSDLSAGADALLSQNYLQESPAGKTIGTNLGGFGELFVRQFLADYKTQESEITLVHMDASEAQAKLASGEVDIAHTWEPYVSEATSKGARIVYTSRQTSGLIPDVIIFRGNFMAMHPEQMRQFVDGWFAGQAWWMDNPREGNHILREALKLEEDVDLKGIKLMTLQDNQETFFNTGNPRSLPRVMEKYVDFFFMKRAIPQRYPLERVIDGRFIPKPESLANH